MQINVTAHPVLIQLICNVNDYKGIWVDKKDKKNLLSFYDSRQIFFKLDNTTLSCALLVII